VNACARARFVIKDTVDDMLTAKVFAPYSKIAAGSYAALPTTAANDTIFFADALYNGTINPIQVANLAQTSQIMSSGTFLSGDFLRTSGASGPDRLLTNVSTERTTVFCAQTLTDTACIQYRQDGALLDAYTETLCFAPGNYTAQSR